MAPTLAVWRPLLLLPFPAGVYVRDSALSFHSSPQWSSQQMEDFWRQSAAQVLPGLLSRHVPQLHVGVELLNQQLHYVLVSVDGCNVERRVAAC